MSTSEGLLQRNTEAPAGDDGETAAAEFAAMLRQVFGVAFAVFDGQTGQLLFAASPSPVPCDDLQIELCRAVARRGRPEFLEDEDPFVVLAVPASAPDGSLLVAVATFVTRPVDSSEDVSRAAEQIGLPVAEAAAWASRQRPASADSLMRNAETALGRIADAQRVKRLEKETASLSANLANIYEEISLLYRLTQNLRISQSDEELGRLALKWLMEVVPAWAMVLQLLPVSSRDVSPNRRVRTESLLLVHGECALDNRQFTALVEHLDPASAKRPVVANPPRTEREDWPCAAVRQMIVVPLTEGENRFGYLAALNHRHDGEFGTMEASLLSTVAAILGIHSGNIDLYRQQSELMAGIIRALTSAIDAKDPYTCGHSDRVSRIAVRLAEELGCDAETLNTIYLSGLLHDIGKIGIDDHVLRKPGKLSEEEFEHIKRHVQIGHKILSDLGKLEQVLPVILHHHESWDGGGYPGRLASEEIPLAARIVAVADAYDAMGSDRPYRKGMPDEKIDAIFRAGAGRQWDAAIVEAFFRARDDIRQIARTEQPPPECLLPLWK